MNLEELYTALLELVEKSEARIDRTNEMVCSLTRTCERNIEVYDKHISLLEESRAKAEANAVKSIETCNQLTGLIGNLRSDYQDQLNALKAELHSMKDEYQEQMVDMRKDYKELSASYRRLAEAHTHAGASRSDVKINM